MTNEKRLNLSDIALIAMTRGMLGRASVCWWPAGCETSSDGS